MEKFKTDRTIENRLFDIMLVIFFGYNIFDNSAWCALYYGPTIIEITRYVKYTIALLCIIVVVINLVKKKYSLKVILLYALLGAIIAASAYYSGTHTYIWYFFIFAAAYKQDAKRAIFISAVTTAVMLAAIVGASQVGLAADHIFDAATRARHGLGFGWTTTAPIMFLFFIMQYVYLRRERAKFYEYIILEGIAVYFYVMTNTRFAFLVSTAVLLFMFVEGFLKNRWKFWKKLRWVFILLPVIICICSLALFLLYNKDSSLWTSLDSLLHKRLSLGSNGIQTYGITVFGQPIEWHGYYITIETVQNYDYVDCSYLQILLQFGVLFIAAVIALYTRSMYAAAKAEDYHLIWILTVILIFSVMEPRLMNMTFNPFILAAFLKLDDSVSSA